MTSASFLFEDKDGCSEIIMLDNLNHHRSTCIYRSDAKVICDMGCNQEITRREYRDNSCDVHLKNKISCQQKEIIQLRDEVRLQCNEKINAENAASGLREEMAKLNDEIIQLREVVAKFNGLPSQVQPSHKLRLMYRDPPAWHKYVNMKIQCDGPIIMEKNDHSKFSLAQSAYCLDPWHPCFKVVILKSSSNSITIGLTSRGPSIKPPGYHKGSYGYTSSGTTVSNNTFETITEMWEEGDVITCAVTFLNNYQASRGYSVIHFLKNDKEIKKYFVNSSQVKLFPTVYMQK